MPAFDESHLPNIARERRLTHSKAQATHRALQVFLAGDRALTENIRMAFWRAALLMMNTYAWR